METLADRIARDGPLNELDAVGWIIRLSKRLESLHTLGVAHGSVSPACILTEAASRSARGIMVDLMRTHGNPAFHSPERVNGASLSQADDAWAVGATLYALLTGSQAFEGATPEETRERILSGAPAPLAVFDVGDDDLQRILDDVFSRASEARMTKVADIRTELTKWHPDAGIDKLDPLDDEDATDDGDLSAGLDLGGGADRAVVRVASGDDDDYDDDDDDARTVLRSALTPAEMGEPAEPEPRAVWAPAPGGRRAARGPIPPPRGSAPGRPLPPPPPPSRAAAPQAAPAPRDPEEVVTKIVSAAVLQQQAAQDLRDDDDDDDIRTVMRPSLNFDDVEERRAAQAIQAAQAAQPPSSGGYPRPPAPGSWPQAPAAPPPPAPPPSGMTGPSPSYGQAGSMGTMPMPPGGFDFGPAPQGGMQPGAPPQMAGGTLPMLAPLEPIERPASRVKLVLLLVGLLLVTVLGTFLFLAYVPLG